MRRSWLGDDGDPSGGARPTATLITGPLVRPSFNEAWPTVATALERLLRARGVDPVTAEDVVQEVAERAWRLRVPFTDAADLFRWASVVGWRLAVDDFRRVSRRGQLRGDHGEADAGSVASDEDVEDRVEARLLAERVLVCLPALSDADQAALLDSPRPAGDRREAVRLAVRRHRARQRLLALVEAAGVVLGIALRRLGRPSTAVPVTAALLVVAMGVHSPLPSVSDVPPISVDVDTGGPTASEADAGSAVPTATRPSSVVPAAAVVVEVDVDVVPPIRHLPDWRGREVIVPSPTGSGGTAGIRPKDESEPLACADTVVGGHRCLDAAVSAGDVLPPR